MLHDFPELLFRPGDSKELAFLLINLLRGAWDASKYIEQLREHYQVNYLEETEKTKWLEASTRAIKK